MLKVGDKVRVKSLDWYNKNKDSEGNVRVPWEVAGHNLGFEFTRYHSEFCGEKCIVTRIIHGTMYCVNGESLAFVESMFE